MEKIAAEKEIKTQKERESKQLNTCIADKRIEVEISS
jgi:hypothetical protein